MFDDIIGSRLTDEDEKILLATVYLRTSQGNSHLSCINFPREQGYQEARRLLHKEYGNIDKISSAYVPKILQWPNLKEGEVTGFRNFLSSLQTFYNSLMCGSSTLVGLVDHPLTLKRLFDKLPSSMRYGWCKRAVKVQKRTLNSPKLNDFVDYTEQNNELLSVPYFGHETFDTRDHQLSSGSRKT